MKTVHVAKVDVTTVQLVDIVCDGIASFNDMLRDVVGDDDDMARSAIVEINNITELLTRDRPYQVNELHRLFRVGNAPMIVPDQMDMIEAFNRCKSQFMIEVKNGDEHITFIKGEDIDY